MTSRFNSFDSSRFKAFAESKVMARNPIKKESVTPIIIITPTVRQVIRHRWVYHDGWDRTQSPVGPNRYDLNPSLWQSDLQAIIDSLVGVETHDWHADGLIKPNYVIWIWQPIHESLGHVDSGHVFDLIGSPAYPRRATVVTRIRITSTSLLTGGGAPIPSFVENVRQIPINAEPLQLSRTTDFQSTSPISVRLVPAGAGIDTPMRMPRIGEVYRPDGTYYWLSQPSLSQLFLEGMEDRPLDCVREEPSGLSANKLVYVRVLHEAELGQFTNPFTEESPRRAGEKSPKDEFMATVKRYRSTKEEVDPCGGTGLVSIDWSVSEGWSHLIKILNDYTREFHLP